MHQKVMDHNETLFEFCDDSKAEKCEMNWETIPGSRGYSSQKPSIFGNVKNRFLQLFDTCELKRMQMRRV